MRMQRVHPLHSVHVGVHAAAGMHELLGMLRQPLCQTVTVLPPEDVPDGTSIAAPAGGAVQLPAAQLGSTDTIPGRVSLAGQKPAVRCIQGAVQLPAAQLSSTDTTPGKISGQKPAARRIWEAGALHAAGSLENMQPL